MGKNYINLGFKSEQVMCGYAIVYSRSSAFLA